MLTARSASSSLAAMADDQPRHELAIRTAVAVVVGGAGLLGPDAGAAATALTPAMEVVLTRVVGSLGQRRSRHAAEALEYGADAAGEPLEQFAERAVADERRQELLARTLTIAQDTALRDKRRALGRARIGRPCAARDPRIARPDTHGAKLDALARGEIGVRRD
jgi:hypothetical protein